MKLEDVSKNSILEELEDLHRIGQYEDELFGLISSNLKDSFWTGKTKSVIKTAINNQGTLINNFKFYLQKCIDALPNLDTYQKQAAISGEKKMALYNYESYNKLQTSAPYATNYDDVNQRRTHESLRKEYNSAVSKQNEIKQILIDAFNSYVLSGHYDSIYSSFPEDRIYNIDKIESYLNDFEDLMKKLQTKYKEPYESGYIYSCDNDVIKVLKYRINKYFELMMDNNLKIQAKWREIVDVLKKVYQSTNVANGGNPSGYSNQEIIMPELPIINKDNLLVNVDKIPGTVSDVKNAAQTVETKYPDIKIGSSVGNFDVSKGHMTAADAVNARDTRNLINKYVNSDNSKFKSFAIVNEDGTVSNIERADGLSLQEYCEKYGVDIGRVAVDVSDKNGTSQAWISVNELSKDKEEINKEADSLNLNTQNKTNESTDDISTANEIISKFLSENPVDIEFVTLDNNGQIVNSESARDISIQEYCKKYNINFNQIYINNSDTYQIVINIKDFINGK